MRKTSLSSVLRLTSSRFASLVSCLASSRCGRAGARPSRASSGRLSNRCSPSPLTFTFLLSLSLLVSSAQAEDWGFAYSGKLLEKYDGVPEVARVGGSTSYVTNFYVRLYDDSDGTATNVLWEKLITDVPVKEGNFAFEVRGTGKDGVVLQDAFAALSGDRLSIGVTPFDANHREIAPRQQLVAVPFAALAGDALGTRGDIRLDSTLTAAAVSVASATFEGDVTHTGDVTFNERVEVPQLTLADGKAFAVNDALVATNALKAARLQTDKLVAGEATVTFDKVRTLAVGSNLTVTAGVKTPVVSAADGKSLVLDGEATVSEIEAAKVELKGTFDLFNFGTAIAVIPYRKEASTGDSGYWHANGDTGTWTTPQHSTTHPHNYFVSLSLCVTNQNQATVSVGGQAVATLGVSGETVTSGVWMPFQAFLKPGETISWTGGGAASGGDNTVRLVYREVGF